MIMNHIILNTKFNIILYFFFLYKEIGLELVVCFCFFISFMLEKSKRKTMSPVNLKLIYFSEISRIGLGQIERHQLVFFFFSLLGLFLGSVSERCLSPARERERELAQGE